MYSQTGCSAYETHNASWTSEYAAGDGVIHGNIRNSTTVIEFGEFVNVTVVSITTYTYPKIEALFRNVTTYNHSHRKGDGR